MTKVIKDSIIPDESILSKIYIIRGRKVTLDRDKKIEAIFSSLKKLKSADQALSDFKNRDRIGYKP